MISLRLTFSFAFATTLAILIAAGCGNEGPGSTGGSGGAGGSTSSTGGHGGTGGAGGGVPCGDQTCAPGQVCVVQVDTDINRFCTDDNCAPEPLSCDCASPILTNIGCGESYYCVSATNGQISCMPWPDAGTD
jgi:hypothetical protein